jgi:hypothetical protein
MASLEEFLPYVALHCPDVAEPSMLHEIRAACVLFCERTRVWKAIETLNVRANRGEYEIPVDSEAVVVAIEEAIFNGSTLRPEALDVLKTEWRDWITQTGSPILFTQLDPDNLRLVPVPNADYPKGLTLRITYKPDRTAKSVPDWLFQQYAEVIAAGAIGRLTGTRAFACFDPAVSGYYLQLFAAGADKALHEADKSFTRAPRRTKARFL